MVDFENNLDKNTSPQLEVTAIDDRPLPWEEEFLREDGSVTASPASPSTPPREMTQGEKGLADNPPEWDPSKDQTRAISNIKDWMGSAQVEPLHTMGGIAGSGKSTLLGKLAYDLLSAKKSVKFVSPTGKAALVLNESLARSGVLYPDAGTVHSLIYTPDVCPRTGKVLGWIKRHSLDADLIVVDEASMVSRKMYDDLSSFGVPILAVGDHKQLPPVGEPPFLMKSPMSVLDKVHRQAKNNPIIRLATWARNGADDRALIAGAQEWGGDSVFVAKNDKEAREFGKPDGFCISYTNSTRTAINAAMRLELYDYDDMEDPQPGETVICLKNHRTDGMMIPNGVRGVIQSNVDTPSYYQMTVDFGSVIGTHTIYANKHQFLRDKTFKGFDEVPGEHKSWYSVGALLDFGYGISGHKSVVSDTLLYPIGQPPKKISEFKSGDKILGVNEQGEVIETEVVDLHDHGTLEAYEICFDDGYTVACSKDHKFLTDRGQVSIEEIVREGLEVLCASSKERRMVGPVQDGRFSEQESDGATQESVRGVQGSISIGDDKEKGHREVCSMREEVPHKEVECPPVVMRNMPRSSGAETAKRWLGHVLRNYTSEVHGPTGAPQSVRKMYKGPNKNKDEAWSGSEYSQQNNRGRSNIKGRAAAEQVRPRTQPKSSGGPLQEFESLEPCKSVKIAANGCGISTAAQGLAQELPRTGVREGEESSSASPEVGTGEPRGGRGKAYKGKGERYMCRAPGEVAQRKPREVQSNLDENDSSVSWTVANGGMATEQRYPDMARCSSSVWQQAKASGLRIRKRLGRGGWLLALFYAQGYRKRARKASLCPKQGRYAEEGGPEERGMPDTAGYELFLEERQASACVGTLAYSHAPLSSTGSLVRRKVLRVSYLGTRRMYDLEVSHPKHNFLLPNGIVTSNSQGSQADDVSVFLETWLLKKIGEEDAARWRYTAFTRAVKRLMLRMN